MLTKNEGSSKTEDAVVKALRWLKETQNEDGSWSRTNTTYAAHAKTGRAKKRAAAVSSSSGDNVQEAISALALLSFVGHGEDLDSKELARPSATPSPTSFRALTTTALSNRATCMPKALCFWRWPKVTA